MALTTKNPTVFKCTASACFSPTLVNAARVAFPPSRRFDVTAARLRTWMEEWSGSDRAPSSSSSSARSPPSTSSSYLPASLDDRQTAARRPAAARRAVSEPGRRLTFFHRRFSPLHRRRDHLHGPASEFGHVRETTPASLFFVFLRALFSSCPSRHMEKMARPLPINPTFLPPTHGVLKSLLENPLKLPFHHDEGTVLFMDSIFS